MARRKRNEVTETSPGTFEVADDTPIPQIESSAARTRRKTKKSAAERTDTLPGLTETKSGVTVSKDDEPIYCPKCGGHGEITDRSDMTNPQQVKCPAGCDNGIVTQQQHDKISEDIMASKKSAKKSGSKKSAAKKTTKAIETAAPIGRERKLLLRLSNEEYEALQKRAAQKGTSMANLLRTSAIG